MDDPQYYAVMTRAGSELEARALETGKGIILTHIAVGDANQQEVAPSVAVKQLVHEVYRKLIDARSIDENDPAVTILSATIPPDEGGWWIYELGVIGHLEGEEEEVLYAYANHAPYYKMLPQTGQSISHEISIPIIQKTDAHITLELPSGDYITRETFLNPQKPEIEPALIVDGDITLPEGSYYWVGQSRLLLHWCGMRLREGDHYEEVGVAGTRSTTLKLLFTPPADSKFYLEIYN